MSALKDTASLNIADMSVTQETSHVPIGPFGSEHLPIDEMYRQFSIATRRRSFDCGENAAGVVVVMVVVAGAVVVAAAVVVVAGAVVAAAVVVVVTGAVVVVVVVAGAVVVVVVVAAAAVVVAGVMVVVVVVIVMIAVTHKAKIMIVIVTNTIPKHRFLLWWNNVDMSETCFKPCNNPHVFKSKMVGKNDKLIRSSKCLEGGVGGP